MGPKIKINANPSRSFCYYNQEGKRIKIYNGKQFREDIYPNKEKDITKRKILLNQLKKIIKRNLSVLKPLKNIITSRKTNK